MRGSITRSLPKKAAGKRGEGIVPTSQADALIGENMFRFHDTTLTMVSGESIVHCRCVAGRFGGLWLVFNTLCGK